MDPIGFATTRRGRERARSGGARSSRRCAAFRRWIGMLVMVNDDNNGSVRLDEDGDESFAAAFTDGRARAHWTGRSTFSRDVLGPRARRASSWTGLITQPRAGDVPDGQRPGAVGRRRGLPVVGREAALRRRRLGRARGRSPSTRRSRSWRSPTAWPRTSTRIRTATCPDGAAPPHAGRLLPDQCAPGGSLGTLMTCVSVNSSNPSCPSSRPMPLWLKPPNGARSSTAVALWC